MLRLRKQIRRILSSDLKPNPVFVLINQKRNIKSKSVIPSNIKKSADEDIGGDSQADDNKTVSVALIGGGITPAYTALLLKQAPIIKFINVGDTKDKMSGSILDASYVDTSAKIRYFKKNNATEAMREVDIIALMDEDDFTSGKASSHGQFLASSRYVKSVAQKMAQSCPAALVAVFTHPITATLPLVSEIYKCTGCWDPDRIIGSLAIESMRIEAMVANLFDLDPVFTSVPIVGGADACTIVPLLSQARPVNQFSKEEQNSLIQTLRASDNELASINKNDLGGGGPKLSAAVAAAKFIIKLANGYCGYKNSVASGFVRSNVLPACKFFSTELQFGPGGVYKNFGLPKVSTAELELIEQAIPLINANVDLVVDLLRKEYNKSINKM